MRRGAGSARLTFCERIEDTDACRPEVRVIARHDGEFVHQRDGGDLLVDLVFRMGNAQAAPDLCSVGTERQDVVALPGLDPSVSSRACAFR